MSAKKGGSARSKAKPTKPAVKRSLRDLDVANDKSKNIKGGTLFKFVKIGSP